jgi:hypothetical protein
MSGRKDGAKSIHAQVSLTTTSLPAQSHRFVEMPGCRGFDSTAHSDNVQVLGPVFGLEVEGVHLSNMIFSKNSKKKLKLRKNFENFFEIFF